jgi:ABC-2 type transport system permease protein
MNWRAIFAIVHKDLKVVAQNKGVAIPIIILPVVFFVVLPWLLALAPALVNVAGASANDIDELIARMPAGLQQELAGLNLDQTVIVFFMMYLLAPMFLIVPLMVSSVIAADSIAGEKERKTLEALLYTPTTDRELFLAKLLSAWLAAVAVSLGGFLLYVVMANAAGWSVMQRVFFPNAMWLVLIVWVAPAVAGLGLGVMVLVSARAQGFQDANQLGGVVVIPVLLLLFAQISGVMWFNIGVAMLLGLVIWLLDGLLIWLGSRSFRRNRLLAA